MRKNRPFLPVVLVFVILNALFISGKSLLKQWRVDQDVLIIGNAILFAITLVSYLLAKNSLKNSNPNVFVRAIIGGIMIKLFVAIIATFVYIATSKYQVNKPALFTCMGLYLVYTFIEVSVLTKELKRTPNAPQRSTP
jgi:hypothetical protein